MDKRALVDEHLAQAERHVLEGEALVARQREIVERLGRGGHDTREAMDLLTQFEETQALHIQERDRLRQERAELKR